MRLSRQGYAGRTDSVRLSLAGRDRVPIHQHLGIRLVPVTVVDRAKSWLDPAAFDDALTQSLRIQIPPGLEALHDQNSDQDDCRRKQKQKCDHGNAYRKRDRRVPHPIHHRPSGQAGACSASRAVTPPRRAVIPGRDRALHRSLRFRHLLLGSSNSARSRPARWLRIDFGRTGCTNAG